MSFFSQGIMFSNRFSSRERFTLRFQAFLIFILCALVLQVWFAFTGHFSLQQTQPWSEVVALKTALVSPRTNTKKVKKSLVDGRLHLSKDISSLLDGRKNNSKEGTKKFEARSQDHREMTKKIISVNQKNNVQGRKRKRIRGQLFVTKWHNLCCESINCLRKHPLFPKFPSHTSSLNKLYVGNAKRMTAQRIVGTLTPPSTGWYTIQVECQSTCEVWLSGNNHSENSELFAKVVHDTVVNVTSTNRVHLSHHKTYYIDIMFSVYRAVSHALAVSWKIPNSRKFVLIDERDIMPLSRKLGTMSTLSPALQLTSFLESIEEMGEEEEEFKLLRNKNHVSGGSLVFDGYTINVDRNIELDSNITMMPQISAIKICVPMNRNETRNVTKHTGVWRTAFSSVFPRDNTGYMACIGNRYPSDCKGNARISLDRIRKLLRLYNDALKSENNLQITDIMNMEKRKDSLKGSTYILECLLRNKTSNVKLHDIRYLSMNKQGTTLCSPHETLIDRNVVVNIVIVVKQQPRWLKYFLTNIEENREKTRDEKINIIIAYYGKENSKVIHDFRNNNLTHIQEVRLFGKFNKTEAIQSAVDMIADENSIIFLMDLHIIIPTSMMSLVRKHTIQRKTAFNPVLFRLTSCASPGTHVKPAVGFWETFGYGIMGIYKSDWDRIGGYGITQNTTRSGWGGEDWGLLDRILSAGLDVQRLKVPNFYHFHHTKHNMWN